MELLRMQTVSMTTEIIEPFTSRDDSVSETCTTGCPRLAPGFNGWHRLEYGIPIITCVSCRVLAERTTGSNEAVNEFAHKHGYRPAVDHFIHARSLC